VTHGVFVFQERTALSSSVLSPTQSALSSLPSDKLVGRTMEGKKLRRHVLRGAVVVFVTAGYSGKKCVAMQNALPASAVSPKWGL
jgi:hypothetical protein